MENSTPLGMGSIIGLDAAQLGSSVNRNRRATDPGNQTFAEVYDLAAFAATGSKQAARVDLHPAPAALATLPEPQDALRPVDRAAADRLYLHLTTGGSFLHVTDDQAGTVVMRLHDADGQPVRQLSITELASDDGPEVA